MNLATLNPARARFCVPLRHRDTGEHRAVVVTLPREARLEAQENIALRGIGGYAWPRANMRAVQTACARLPEYEWTGDPITAAPPPELHIVSNHGASDTPCARNETRASAGGQLGHKTTSRLLAEKFVRSV